MTHKASSKISKNIFQKFADWSNSKLTMCYIPAGILKLIAVQELSYETVREQESFQYIANIDVLDFIKPVSYEFAKMSDEPAFEALLKPIKIEYTPPIEWYYTLDPSRKDKT